MDVQSAGPTAQGAESGTRTAGKGPEAAAPAPPSAEAFSSLPPDSLEPGAFQSQCVPRAAPCRSPPRPQRPSGRTSEGPPASSPTWPTSGPSTHFLPPPPRLPPPNGACLGPRVPSLALCLLRRAARQAGPQQPKEGHLQLLPKDKASPTSRVRPGPAAHRVGVGAPPGGSSGGREACAW